MAMALNLRYMVFQSLFELCSITVFKKIFFDVYLFLIEKRERECAQAGEGQRERENLKWAPGSELSAQSLTELKSDT